MTEESTWIDERVDEILEGNDELLQHLKELLPPSNDALLQERNKLIEAEWHHCVNRLAPRPWLPYGKGRKVAMLVLLTLGPVALLTPYTWLFVPFLVGLGLSPRVVVGLYKSASVDALDYISPDEQEPDEVELAAEQGDADAQYRLARRHAIEAERWNGIGRDFAKEAERWYIKAAEQGHARAYYRLGGVQKNDTVAIVFFRLAAEQSDADAQYQLGKVYDWGTGGEKDAAEAVRWYRLAAEQEHAKAQAALGLMYLLGKGVERDRAKACEWEQRAAENGYVAV
ncbi:MAG: tetratricopeptide repeat protein [Acidobacteria bacterium]|nr:tetratricopeptide repeat protein [Acidobacteriota bacterium]